jgi:hypothetical protein
MRILRKKDQDLSSADTAIILFDSVKNGLMAEKVLLNEDYYARKVAPPPEFRKGCEISVEIMGKDQKNIEELLLKKGISYQKIISPT